jgi:hypothetical protein
MTVNTVTENGVIRELAFRSDAGGSVRLLWDSSTEEISLEVKDKNSEFTVRDIPADSAMDAWHHPYSYAEFQLKTGKTRRVAA